MHKRASGSTLPVFRNFSKYIYSKEVATLALNKRAKFDYETLETYEGGLALIGSEVKSVRAGHISLRGAFITMQNEEAYLTNATIPPWQQANTPAGYDPTRSRKVLLKKSELDHLIGAKQTQGLTIIPISVYTKGPWIKIEIALARGRKKVNKKEQKKEQDIKRDVERILRGKDL